jgi:hypothetical protein
MRCHSLNVRFALDSVAKLSLRSWANRDSVVMRRRIAGEAHDGAAGERTGTVILRV